MIGDDIDWFGMKAMLDQAPHAWHGAAFFPARLADPGPISDELARLRLYDLKQQVTADRLVLNSGAFFDDLGRLMKIEQAPGISPRCTKPSVGWNSKRFQCLCVATFPRPRAR